MNTKDKNYTIKKVANVWTKLANPIRFLNNWQIEQMLETARFGNDSKLQLCFFECEKNNAIFSACINKRIAGVQNRMWTISPMDNSDEARRQADKIMQMFEQSDNQVEDNLTNAIRHLTLGSFRGRSAVKPFIKDDKLFFKCLDNWNFLRYQNKLYWNPEVSQTPLIEENWDKNIVELNKDEVCYFYDDKPIDWIGIQIYLRQLVGEETYSRFIEKCGIPQILLTTPENVPEEQLGKFNLRAEAIYEGASGTLPYGSDIKILTEARSQDPFTSYITHQSELFCILATGGTLDILAGSQGSSGTGMGSDVSNNQKTQFESLVTYDCKRIQNALIVAVEKCCKYLGYKECKCKFEFIEKENTDPITYLEIAKQLVDLGIGLDIQELKRLTHISFIKENEQDLWTPKGDDEK